MLISIVNLSQCSKYDGGFFLLSPDFFQKDKLIAWDLLSNQSNNSCHHYFDCIKDTVASIEEKVICYDLTDGIPKFFDNGFETENINSNKKIGKVGDFAISRLRSYLQEMGIVENRTLCQLFSTEFLIFRSKTKQLSTHTLFALCMTRNLQTILNMGQYGTEHPRFYDFLLTNLPIPDCLLNVDYYISKIIADAIRIRNRARNIFAETENLLLAELGLTDWQPQHCPTFVKNYSDTQQAQRIDAEYFQPKYDEIINAIRNYPGGWDTVGDLLSLKDKNFTPQNDKKYRYIELANIGNNGMVVSSIMAEGEKLPSRARRQVGTGDIIVSSIEGSLSSIALIDVEYDLALCSTGFHVVNSGFFNSETLLVLLKSIIGQLQLKKGCGGTILTAVNKSELQKIILPKIEEGVQTEIKRKVTESFQLRKRSQYLLECAKRAVEIAIEQGETVAIDWLQQHATNSD